MKTNIFYIVAVCIFFCFPIPYSLFAYRFFTNDSVKVYDIEINEIMADPTPELGLPPNEYIELYNRSDKAVNLSGWSLHIGTRTRIFSDLVSIEHRGYLIITDTASVKLFSKYGKVYGFSSLIINNTGQTIILDDEKGKMISAVSFTDDWYQSSYKMEGGWSLEQIDPDNPCGGKSNWKASNDFSGGTPGRKNSVFNVNPDNTIPELDRVCVLDSMTIELFFNEPLDSASLNSISYFNIDNEIGAPSEIILMAPFYNTMILKLNNFLKEKIIYTVSITKEFQDCAGNKSVMNCSARFAIPEAAQPNDIIINEILTNPKDNGAQFIEIYNRSQKVIDLKDLLLCTMDTIANALTSQKNISEIGYSIFPQEYYALTTNPDAVRQQYYTSNPKGFIQISSIPQYNQDNGIVVISDKPGNIIDKLVYTLDMQFALLTDTKGVSLERLSFDKPTQEKSNWHSAAENAGFATPAYKNSQYIESAVSDNDITISPEIFSPDNDGHDDVVAINYSFSETGYLANVTIFDSRGRQVRSLIKNELIGATGSFIWDGINDKNEKALIGIYVIYIEVHNLHGKVKHYKKTAVLGGKLK